MRNIYIFFAVTIVVYLAFGCTNKNTPSFGSYFQLIQFREAKNQEFIQMTPDLKVPAEDPGYTLILPNGPARGMIVLFHSGRDTAHPGFEQQLYRPAVAHQVAMMYVTTGHPFDFLFDTLSYRQLDRYIGAVVQEQKIPADRLLFGGMSLAGTRAMKFARWCLEGHSNSGLIPRALVLCDAPLDFFRFWREAHRSILLKSNPVSVNESTWVNYQLETNLGGTPAEAPEAYRNYSPYVYDSLPDSRLNLFRNVAIRAYTEPDVQWWMENRQKSYYSMNAVDAAALINDLQILGNQEAELIATTGKGQRPDGTRHPHSWSIVDNEALVKWLLELPPKERQY